MIDYTSLIGACEAAVRDGQADQVAGLLGDLNLGQIPREHRLPLANICRRTLLLSLGMRILTPAVREQEENRLAPAPTPGEMAEYAMLLIRYGAVAEALSWLNRVSPAQVPDARLYKSFCHINQWDYARARVELESYILQELSPYSRLIGNVNLAACNVALQNYAVAFEQLNECRAVAAAQGYGRLLGNCLELRAQVYLQAGDFERSLEDLEAAAKIFGPEKTFDELFVRKWKSVLAAFKTQSPEPLIEFRKEALSRGDSESCRESDFFRLKVRFEEPLFEFLYFGTPFSGYRERILADLRCSLTISRFEFGHPGSDRRLELATGAGTKLPSLGKNQKPQQLLAALCRDFYRPIRLGSLHALLFPEERFDVTSSPNRIHQILFRLRKWAAEASVELDISVTENGYWLKPPVDFCIEVPVEPLALDRHLAQISELRKAFAESPIGFTAEQAISVLQISPDAFRRLAHWGIDSQHFERTGQARGTRYFFVLPK